MNITLLLKQLVGPTYLYIVLGIVCYRRRNWWNKTWTYLWLAEARAWVCDLQVNSQLFSFQLQNEQKKALHFFMDVLVWIYFISPLWRHKYSSRRCWFSRHCCCQEVCWIRLNYLFLFPLDVVGSNLFFGNSESVHPSTCPVILFVFFLYMYVL